MVSSFLIGASLSMDNLAVAISTGCAEQVQGHEQTIWKISLLFALAHFVMFSLGFEGGALLHAGRAAGAWMACVILVFIGTKMIQSAWRADAVQPASAKLLRCFKTQVVLAGATSLDALWAGAGMAFSAASFWQVAVALVICVLLTSLSGFFLGQFLGRKFGRKMETAGGVVLILFGVRVLLAGVGIW